MDSSKDTSLIQRLGRLFGIVGLAVAGVVVSIYAVTRKSNQVNGQSSPIRSPEVAPGDDTSQERTPHAEETTEDHTFEPADTSLEDAAEESPREDASEADDSTPALDESVERIHDETTVRSLEDLTVEELYRLAQRHDIAGRSSMRKAQLLEALQADGIAETES